MFHLLVAYRGWSATAGSISNSRIYIRPTDEPGGQFLKPDGRLDPAKVSSIPALIMTEIGGDGPQLARVVYITSINQGSSETAIQYTNESGIGPIPNEVISEYAPQLGIQRGSLTHTHWEVKQADLFKIILMHQQKLRPASTVFDTGGIDHPDPSLASVMMPFDAAFNPVYEAIRSAVSSRGLNPMRADNFWEHPHIIQDIVNLIAKARVVICDLSNRNPNVFYEAGIAHALGKEVILLVQSDSDVPFDLRHIRYIKYLNNSEGLAALTSSISSRLHTLLGY